MRRTDTYYVNLGKGNKSNLCTRLKPLVDLYEDASVCITNGQGEYPFLIAPPIPNVRLFNLTHAFDKIVTLYKESHTGIDWRRYATGNPFNSTCDKYNLFPVARLYVTDQSIKFSIGILADHQIKIDFLLDYNSVKTGDFVIKNISTEGQVFKNNFRTTVSPLLLQMWGISNYAFELYPEVYIDEVILFPFATKAIQGIGPNISDVLCQKLSRDRTWLLGDSKPSCKYLIMTD